LDNTQSAHIRAATVNDAIAIHLLNTFSLGYDYPIDKTRKRVAFIINNQNARLLVAEVNGEVVGYIHATDYDCSYSDSLKNILALAVDEDHRGKGIGQALVTAVENWARNANSIGVRLVSSAYRTGAHEFYKACGYTDRKDQKNFIKML